MKKPNFYHPKVYPTWVLIALMKLGAKLPFKLQVLLGKLIGRLLYPLLGHFRKTAIVNISRCFPEKNISQIEVLCKQHFEAIGVSLFETANAYFGESQKIQKLLSIENEKYLTKAIEDNKSIVPATTSVLKSVLCFL